MEIPLKIRKSNWRCNYEVKVRVDEWKRDVAGSNNVRTKTIKSDNLGREGGHWSAIGSETNVWVECVNACMRCDVMCDAMCLNRECDVDGSDGEPMPHIRYAHSEPRGCDVTSGLHALAGTLRPDHLV